MRELAEIYEEMCAAFAEKAGFRPEESCDAAVRLYALAMQVQALEREVEWTLDQSFAQTAQGAYLDRHAALRALSRGEAARAVGMLRFAVDAPTANALPVPAGTVCLTADGVRFRTTADAVLAAGGTQVDVSAEAVEPGPEGNVIAGSVTLFSVAPVGIVHCGNPAAFAGGCAAESDESLRARILESYRCLPNGANAAFYEQEAQNVPGVAAAKAVGRARGIGTVDVYVAAESGLPSDVLRGQVCAALEAKREVAVDVQVKSPAAVSVNVTATVSAEEGAEPDEVLDAVRAAVQAFFSGARLGKSVSTAQLGALIFGVPGVANCHLLAPAADVAVGETALAVLGTLQISGM